MSYQPKPAPSSPRIPKQALEANVVLDGLKKFVKNSALRAPLGRDEFRMRGSLRASRELADDQTQEPEIFLVIFLKTLAVA